MSDCASAYTELRDKVVESAEEHLSQERLKCFISTFQPVINSKRRSSYINNFNDLITVLEKRGYVGEANVEPFGKIVNLLPDAPIFQEIYNYQCYMASNRLGGPYVSHALDCVCRDIGTHWKDLARNLSMREGDIDEIEEKYPGKLKERAYECMRRFIKDTDPYKVQQKLLYALDRCGRRDVKEEVEEILNRRPY